VDEGTVPVTYTRVDEWVRITDRAFQAPLVELELGEAFWIEVRLRTDPNPKATGRVRVELFTEDKRLGTPRPITVALAETGLNTGIFRCGPKGILTTFDPASTQSPKIVTTLGDRVHARYRTTEAYLQVNPFVYTKWPFGAAEAKRRQAETAKALRVKAEQDFDLYPFFGAEPQPRPPGVAEEDYHLFPHLTISMVLIPAGEFVIGSPKGEEGRYADEGQKRIVIDKPFWMAKYEVTREQWEAVMTQLPSRRGAKHPVTRVSWNDIQKFLKKLNARVKGGSFALPTEAQWEYACRAGTQTPYHFGETLSPDQANYGRDPLRGAGRKGVKRVRDMPVGSFPPNAWGLRDMHGNVREWCASPYAKTYDRSESKGAEAPGSSRVLRGGSWVSDAHRCRSANRAYDRPDWKLLTIGFRLVRPIP
jgi:formylglycine-generating enzyme required for sulfatase activity